MNGHVEDEIVRMNPEVGEITAENELHDPGYTSLRPDTIVFSCQ
jgi:hypothetical protein